MPKLFCLEICQYILPRNLSNFYDLVIADPPFISDECLTKTALTIKFLAKKKIVLCTGISDDQFSTFKLLNLYSYIILQVLLLCFLQVLLWANWQKGYLMLKFAISYLIIKIILQMNFTVIQISILIKCYHKM